MQFSDLYGGFSFLLMGVLKVNEDQPRIFILKMILCRDRN